MVGSWPCTVSSEVHINGRHVSEPVREDKGKATVPESEDEKDPKRARMVLSKGHEVAGLGYSRLSGDAARVVDRGEESSNPNRLIGFAGNTTRIGERIGLFGTARVTGMDTRVGGQTGLLGTAGVTRTMTQVDGQTGMLRTAGITVMAARVSKLIGLLGSAGVTETATRSREILAGLRKIWLLRKAGVRRIRLTRRARLQRIQPTQRAELLKIWLMRKAGLPNTQVIGKTG
jgi:hypothetical protein